MNFFKALFNYETVVDFRNNWAKAVNDKLRALMK